MPISSRERQSWSRSSKRQARHPGVGSTISFTFTTIPAIAEKGLVAAKLYAEIAPAAPHAQHMPSHIFTRVGYWKESIASNIAAARAAKAGKEFHDQLHAMDYMVYAHLQLGQDKKASEVIADIASTASAFDPEAGAHVGSYAIASSPARYMVERADWKGAAQLQVRASKFAHDGSNYALRPRARRGALGRDRRCQGDIAKLGRVARQAARGEGRLLVGAGRHPVRGRDRWAALRRGQHAMPP